ncbi:flagellar basal body P-ring protein FlgI [Thorsellia anophelis]|uniref:Flagellar P-ring protein n=1 Tax=Thorsellia anophelis DSM 18579 TaxID=1123402 RepID=A0A1H9ZFG8_9GAMM|nr:flagellar basal body P-ring protein FlgI [Thorsellia anophelis]SES80247.1 flagellar P-ring protein precursor FlgI [Thorsellia anophelis DSM 18579]
MLKSLKIALFVIAVCFSQLSSAERIRDLVTIEGVRDNALVGYGLVVGLDGTGDQTSQTPFTTQSLSNMLSQLGVTIPPGTNMQLKNVAAVIVTSNLPAFSRSGQKVDVVVSSLGNAKSLRGGTLLMTPLKGTDNQVYAIAQGNIIVSGASASGGGSSVQVNQQSGGIITDGATVERELPSSFGSNSTLNLYLKNDDFSLAQQISNAINRSGRGGLATAIDSRTVQVELPTGTANQSRFIADIENLNINIGPINAKVVLNSRTGSVAMNREVTLDSCAIAQGSLTVEVNQQQEVNQPNAPLAGGQAVVTDNTQVSVRQSGGAIQKVDSSANLNNVIRALNSLGATPNDLMAILQAMKSAGCLRADLEII